MANPLIVPPISEPAPPRLALRPKEAATALGIGTRLLWQLTNTKQIPHTKLGRCVVYPVAAIEAWLKEQAERGQR